MNLIEAATLAVILKLDNQLSSGLGRAKGDLATFDRAVVSSGPGVTMLGGRFGAVSTAAHSFGGAMGHAHNQIMGVVKSAGLLGGVFGGLGLASAIGSSVKSAMDFGQAMEQIRTQTGASQAEVDSMTKALLSMGHATAMGPNQLAAGLYHIESVGIRGARALDVLRTAAEGARVGNADLESVTNALAAAVYSGIKGTDSMSGAMGTLNAIIGSGNMRMQDLADSMGTGILAAGRAFGLSLTDVGAAMAVLTDQAVPANVAATRLRMSFALMGAPTAAAQKQLKSVGLTATSLAEDMRQPNGLLVALQDLYDHLKASGDLLATGELSTKGAAVVSRAFGGGRQGTTILTLLDSISKLEVKYKDITGQAGKFGEEVSATAETAAFKFKQFQGALGDFEVQLGNALLPVATNLAAAASQFLATNGDGIVAGLNNGITAAEGFAAAIKPIFDLLAQGWGLLPDPLKGFLITGFVAQKASGWLFGSGPLDWAKSLLGFGANKVGLGGLAGALGVDGMRVYVTNWPLGFGAGSNPTSEIPAAAAAGGGGIASMVSSALIAAIPIMAAEFVLSTTTAQQRSATDTAARRATAAARGLNPNNVPVGENGDVRALAQQNLAAAFAAQQTGSAFVSVTDHADRLTGSLDDLRQGANALHDQLKAVFGAHAGSVIREAARSGGSALIGKAQDLADLFRTSLAPSQASLIANIQRLQGIAANGDPRTRAALHADISIMQGILNRVLATEGATGQTLADIKDRSAQPINLHLAVTVQSSVSGTNMSQNTLGRWTPNRSGSLVRM